MDLSRLKVALAVALALTPIAAAAQQEPLHIPVVTSMTGQGAFAGKSEVQAFELIVGIVNRTGGINKRRIHFDILDDASNPQTTLQLVTQLVAQKTPVFLGQTLTQNCNAVAPLVRDKGPVQYCLSPGIKPSAGSFIFSSSLSTEDSAAVVLRYFRERGLTRLAILMGTDATGQQLDHDFEAARARPENAAVTFVAHEHFNISDVSLGAQMSKIKAAHPQALLTWTVGPAFGTLLHAASDLGLDIPIIGSGGDMIYSQLRQYSEFAPKELLFVSTLPFAQDSTGRGPVRDAQARYFTSFKTLRVKPDFPQQLAWDPAWIVIDAYQHLGADASAEQIRSYIAGLHSWAGINGIYDFRDGSQRGIGENSAIMFRWNKSTNDFVTASRRAGHIAPLSTSKQ